MRREHEAVSQPSPVTGFAPSLRFLSLSLPLSSGRSTGVRALANSFSPVSFFFFSFSLSYRNPGIPGGAPSPLRRVLSSRPLVSQHSDTFERIATRHGASNPADFIARVSLARAGASRSRFPSFPCVPEEAGYERGSHGIFREAPVSISRSFRTSASEIESFLAQFSCYRLFGEVLWCDLFPFFLVFVFSPSF